jgi:hypothetical protein
MHTAQEERILAGPSKPATKTLTARSSRSTNGKRR